jgi:DNA-binding CsgD family transcriptional regulator
MPVQDRSYGQLVDLIYAAVEEPQRWREVFEAVCAATGSESVHMLALDHRHRTLSYSDGANLPVQGELAYIHRYRFIDPRMPLIMGRGEREWVHCHEMLGEDFVASDPFYQEFLLSYDRRYMSACKLVDGQDVTVIFSTLRTRAQGPMPGEGVAFLDELLPHLSRATRISIRNFFYSTQSLVGQTLVNRLRQPVILMTPGGDAMHMNDAARQLLDSTPLVRVVDGKVALAGRAGRELLRRCGEIETQLKAGGGGAGTRRPEFESLLVSEPAAGGHPLYAFFTVLPPEEMMGSFGLRPVVMLLFYHPDSAPAIDASLLLAVFGLTPAESRIASLLAEGLSLKEIAREQGVQHDTVRKQLQSIYQKTATNRQPELVRLLLHLPHNAVQAPHAPAVPHRPRRA